MASAIRQSLLAERDPDVLKLKEFHFLFLALLLVPSFPNLIYEDNCSLILHVHFIVSWNIIDL